MSEKCNYELTLERRPQYVYAHVKASSVSSEMVIDFISRSVAFCKEAGVDRLLLVRDIPQMLTDTHIYYAGVEFVKILGDIKCAIVNPFPEFKESLHFVETITSNRGAQHRILPDIAQAEAWLLDDLATK